MNRCQPRNLTHLKRHSRMIIPFPSLQIHLPSPLSLLHRLLKRLRPQLPVLVKLIIGSIVDLDREFLVLGIR